MRENNSINKFVYVLFIILWIGCNQSVKTPEELQTYIQNPKNGLKKEKVIGNITATISYRPTDLLVNQELRTKNHTQEEVEKLRNQYDKYAYFVLNLSAKGKEVEAYQVGQQADFNTRVGTMSFGMRDYLTMITNTQDTIPIADYTYQRTFGVAGSSDMLFAFERDQLQDAKWIQLKLRDFGLGIGNNRFKFLTTAIRKTPEIQF